MKRICSTFALAGFGSFVACDATTFRSNFEDIEPALLYEAAELTDIPTSVEELLVLNYNIKYGGGRLVFFWECDGDRFNMKASEVEQHLDAIVDFINQIQPDILLLQEVDRLSLRSAYIDQVQYILDRTHLNYGAYASQHRADFLPSDGMGKLDFGNATLSRWPIREAQRHALPLIDAHPGYYRYFYLKRHILDATVELPGIDAFHVVNTHLEAFSDDGTKKEQIDQLHAHFSRLGEDALWVGGGDLNSLPPGSLTLKGFADDCVSGEQRFAGDDYSNEEDWIANYFSDFESLMPLEDYQADNSKWSSYSGDPDAGWTRTLDYLFSNASWIAGEGMVMQSKDQGGFETIHLSDHAPVRGVLELGP